MWVSADGLGDGIHRITVAFHQRHAAHAFLPGAEVLNAELRVKARPPLPESAHRLLAPVQNL